MGRLSKTEASSLLEVTVGLVLISIVFGIALTVFLNVTSGTGGWQQTKYQLLVGQVAAESIRDKRFFDEELAYEQVSLLKKVVNYHGVPGLLHLKIEAVDGRGNVLASYNRLIYDPTIR